MTDLLEAALDVAVATAVLAIGARMVWARPGREATTLPRTTSPALPICAAAIVFIVGTCIGAPWTPH
jgi:hypothetical protein